MSLFPNRSAFFRNCLSAKSNHKLNILLTSLLFSLLILTGFTSEMKMAQAAGGRFFPETSFEVKGSFKLYWERKGGLEQFGFPISKEFKQYSPTEPGKWYITQYFQRAIFEYHPENAGTEYDVLLRLAGVLTTSAKGRQFPTTSAEVAAQSGRAFFNETRHSLGGQIQAYWQRTGGLSVYGFPISEELSEANPADGKTYTVQYFERARLELHPENAGTRYEVLLGLLGWQELQLCEVPTSEGDTGLPYRVVLPPELPLRLPARLITPLRTSFGYGSNVWAYDMGDKIGRIYQLTGAAGLGWVRQQIRWDYIESSRGSYHWRELDDMIRLVRPYGLKLVLSVAKGPRWASGEGGGLPLNPDDFYNFMFSLSQRYKGQIAAYEIWNEPNIGLETGGQVSIPRYIETLKAGYRGVKSNDPQAFVLTGGTSPTGVTAGTQVMDDVQFVTECYKYNNGEWRNYFDALAVHPGSAANSPDEFWPIDKPADKDRPWTTHPSFYFRRFENQRDVMVKYGDGDKQIWLTEFGWTTQNSAKGYEYGALNTEQQQADFVVRAFQRGKTKYDYIGVMLIWNLNFSTIVSHDDEKAPWSMLRADYSPRPVYRAVQDMVK